MLTVKQIKALADGHGLVDTFGFCYHKVADGLMCHETDALIKWSAVGPIMLDNLDIIQQTDSRKIMLD